MRLCFVQFGDMKATLERRQSGLAATYRAQYYSVDYVVELARTLENCTVISVDAESDYQASQEGLELRGFKYYSGQGPERLQSSLEEACPTHIVVRTPLFEVFDYAKRHGAKVFPLLADSFLASGWSPRDIKARFNAWRLARALNDPMIDVVANHNVAACRDLVRIGVQHQKIIPWDWPSEKTPSDYEPRALPSGGPFRMLYVGGVIEAKGVGDAIEAFAGSQWIRDNCRLDIVGAGNGMDDLKRTAASVATPDSIVFHGKQPNHIVLEMMREASLVLVPSWHEYSEGLPGTIYEALTVRTPIIMSDHPMFLAYLTDNQGVAFVPEKDPAAIASRAEQLLTDPSAYQALSETTSAAFDRIRCPNLWHEVLGAWLKGDPDKYLQSRLGKW
ncbi:MAG: glycosyltransferase family 4 protein [Pseudomonadota bacterium]